jgi:hypothetical protein
MSAAANNPMDRTNGTPQGFPAQSRVLRMMSPGALRDAVDGVLNAAIAFSLQQVLKILLMARRFNY